MSFTPVYIGVGSNIDRRRSFLASIKALSSLFGSLTLSKVYESEAVGFDGDNFYNMVVGARTDLPLEQVCVRLRETEYALGRAPDARKYSARNADLDLLLYGDCVCHQPVVLPREEITENAFVLQPLAELAGRTHHPALAVSFAALWRDYPKDAQRLWPVEFDWSALGSDVLEKLKYKELVQ